MSETVANSKAGLTEMESATISYFCDGVRALGLPPSVGEIYGLLVHFERAALSGRFR